jgi:hypothetical protein
VATGVISAIAGAPRYLVPALMVLVFAAAFLALRRIWNRTSKRSAA